MSTDGGVRVTCWGAEYGAEGSAAPEGGGEKRSTRARWRRHVCVSSVSSADERFLFLLSDLCENDGP